MDFVRSIFGILFSAALFMFSILIVSGFIQFSIERLFDFTADLLGIFTSILSAIAIKTLYFSDNE
ncbi:hypothetical protein [Bacillus wiedmannii]|uniref:hypothetical protein n=1 Tax=Bacillus wiedmannii TaxID=1890302 RepID=UPI000BFB489E|nr:hypothetical protein [Bacillus wiedmannii]PHE70569.1 hypothetical protein COF77_25485 [Bacillus wiedmannii]